MLIQNPTRDMLLRDAPFCAIRARRPDGTPNVGKEWMEPMGSTWPFIDDQVKWEVVFYNTGDKLPD